MSESLKQERNNISFDINELSFYIYQDKLKSLQEVWKIAGEDPILRNDVSILGRSRIEIFKIYAEKFKRVHELFNATESHIALMNPHFSNQMPASVSTYMFLPYIKHLGTDKQVQKWVEPILRMEIIGTYVQTEMGHGSDVRSLETTATYDPKTDEFVINSPTLTSTKWWPGELGLIANHIVCMAQLIINGEKYGVHGFIINIRDVETNKTQPGIEVGDIGEKVGFNTKDNGYCRFDNVRIPRENMLMRYAKVNKKGEYKRQGDERVGYAIMMQIRDLLGHASWIALSQALTIAVRYSLVRTQFQTEEGAERKVMDYQLQQDKLIPLLAATYAMQAGAVKVSDLTRENIKRIQEKEDFSMMKDLHATVCGTKAFYSYEADAGIIKARHSCGGHGYSSYSALNTIWKEFSPTVTYEGDNTIMALQTARYLVGCLDKLRKGSQLQDNVEYLKDLTEILSVKRCTIKKATELDLDTILDMLKANAAVHIYQAGQALLKGAKSGSFKDSWDKNAGIPLIEAARAHMSIFTYRSFYEKINNEAKSPALKVVLQRLCMLYGIEKLLLHPLGILESEYISPKQIVLLKEKKNVLMEQIRPDVLGLVDAFAYPDNTLKSALGLYDGNVYETLLQWVREKNDFNKYDWTETWEKNIKALRYVKRPEPKL